MKLALKSSEKISGDDPSTIVRTSSPDDPLNWPLWKRDSILAVLFFASFFTTASGALLGTAQVQITTDLQLSLNQYADLSAYWFASVAVGGVVFIPFARVWGKRHQYLLGVILTFAGYLWNARATSFGTFIGARVLQGLGTSAFETLLGTSIGDMYHVYQRGSRLSFTTWSTYAAGSSVIVITGVVVQHLGWRWLFWIIAIPQGIIVLLVFFFVPETSFLRPVNKEASTISEHPSSEISVDVKRSYTQTLSPFRGRVSHQPFYKFFIRPFLVILHPAGLWFVLFNGCTISWGSLMDTIMVITFPSPPLNFTPTDIGFLSFASLAGTIVALVFCALTSDHLAAYLTKRNHGVYQPEFRLVPVVVAIITGFVAMYCFGVVQRDIPRYGWFPSAFFYGLQSFTSVISVVVGSAYIVDGYPVLSNEVFIMFMVVKNMIAFGVLTKAVTWIEDGVYDLMLGTALVQLFLGLSTIPLYIYGQRIRSIFESFKLFHIEL